VSLVHDLSEAPAEAGVVGGKAASLARLARMDLPTPPGFVIEAGAYQAYLDEAGVSDRVGELVPDLPVREAEAELERLAYAHPLPEPLGAELGDAVGRLANGGSGLLAVRSSARQEDSRDRSFAGQHETILGVEPAGVESAVRRCWSSLWSERSASYRAAHDMPAASAGEMAVLVQPLVEADASAVVFTVNPVSGEREEVVVEAARGLGDGIVSGAVTADMIVLDRVTLGPCRFGTGDAEDAAVSVDDAAELAELCLRAERGFRTPLDVEAARDGDGWWLLQARPITTNGGGT
jgi:phosphoenolpyruvate synthase/pyruvate phosphate dikinase